MKRMTTDLNCFDEFQNKEKYGPVAEIDGYVIMFEPSLSVAERVPQTP